MNPPFWIEFLIIISSPLIMYPNYKVYDRDQMEFISEIWSNQAAQFSTIMHHMPDVQAAEHQHKLSIMNMEHQMAAGVAQVKKSEVPCLTQFPPWTFKPLAWVYQKQ